VARGTEPARRWEGARGGWNQRIGAGVARCGCRTRRLYWASLDPRAGHPCCGLPCCLAPHAAIVSTRDELLALRAQVLRRGLACARCGQAIALHHHNFECVDAATRAIRALKARLRR
jgi:hypothetical protein